jgi:quinoprotein glucose dehydrogenase
MTVADVNPFFLSPEQRAAFKDQVASARNEGIFTPPAYKRDTLQIPGARGGANRGSSASDPDKGFVFVTTSDYPGFENIQGTEMAPAAGGARGQRAVLTPPEYQQNCQVCHGADMAGAGGAPSLIGLGSRMNLNDFKITIVSGKGQMPARPDLNENVVTTLYTFLSGTSAGGGGAGGFGRGARGGATEPMTGPVVADGGAPGGLVPALNEAQLRARYGGNNRFVGPPYPEGVDAPKTRLYSNYAVTQSLIGPPWSEIVAYDLNKGTIMWKKPLGEDLEAEKEGGKNTGMLAGGEHQAMVVTAAGLVFVTAKDGVLRAFDETSGDEIWTYKMPAGLTGTASMYEVQGREYLVVGSGAGPNFGMGRGGGGGGGRAAPTNGDWSNLGYIAFALPKK